MPRFHDAENLWKRTIPNLGWMAKQKPRARLVIVGHGMVGHRFCERLLALGGAGRFEITVFGEEKRPAYDRVHLGRHLEGAGLETLALQGIAGEAVEVRTGARIAGIDRAEKRVRVEGGASVPYDVLVLATGASPQVPSIEGSDATNVLLYRTASDVERIAERARASRQSNGRVVVVGGGLLGLELAEKLRQLGCALQVLEASSHLMSRQLDVAAARLLADQLERNGIEVTTGVRIARFVDTSRGARVELEGGETIDCDFVVLATGVRPADELARDAGLRCGPRGGVEVDSFLRTSDASIFAIGDCASFRGAAYGLVAPGYAMAETLAMGLLGQSASFRGLVPATRLKLESVEVNAMGEGLLDGPGTRGLVYADAERYRRLVVRDGHLVGVIAVGAWPSFAQVSAKVAAGARIGTRDIERFLTRGELVSESLPVSIQTWASDAPVCMCTGVTCGALRRAYADGCRTAEALRARTGASSVCGSCRPLLEELTGEVSASGAARNRHSLVAIGAAACMLVLALGSLAPLHVGTSFASPTLGDALLRDATLRQITGYGALTAALLSMLLSLRQRVSWFRFGSYAGLRLVHVALGTVALGGILLHTGLRWGVNLDRVLMVAFVALAMLGGILSVVTGLEGRGHPWAPRVRRALRLLHIAIVWPLPALVLFHVLRFYYF